MNFKAENNVLTIFLSGRIDSVSAPALENEIVSIRAEYPSEKLVLDADSLEYISSAGLRVVLRLLKDNPELEIINANSNVYEVFEITGFSDMLPIHKAYRRVSVENCEVIGQGANGKVYRLDDETIIKVYLNSDSLPDIQRERELAQKAFKLMIPTAIPYDVVRVGDSYGSVFELINSNSLGKLIKKYPEKLDEYVEIYVDLMKKIHSTSVKPGELPDMRQVALDWANFMQDYLPPETGAKLLSLIEAVPEDNHMLHGDYHIKNVMMQNDEALLIDMDTICTGHPVFELASMYNAYLGYAELDHSIVEKFLGIPYESAEYIWKKALPMYLETEDPEKIAHAENSARIIGYTRMIRRSIRRGGLENDRETVDHFTQELVELVEKTDSLL